MKKEIMGYRIQVTPVIRKWVEKLKSKGEKFSYPCNMSIIRNKEDWDDKISLESSEMDDCRSVESTLFPLLVSEIQDDSVIAEAIIKLSKEKNISPGDKEFAPVDGLFVCSSPAVANDSTPATTPRDIHSTVTTASDFSKESVAFPQTTSVDDEDEGRSEYSIDEMCARITAVGEDHPSSSPSTGEIIAKISTGSPNDDGSLNSLTARLIQVTKLPEVHATGESRDSHVGIALNSDDLISMSRKKRPREQLLIDSAETCLPPRPVRNRTPTVDRNAFLGTRPGKLSKQAAGLGTWMI